MQILELLETEQVARNVINSIIKIMSLTDFIDWMQFGIDAREEMIWESSPPSFYSFVDKIIFYQTGHKSYSGKYKRQGIVCCKISGSPHKARCASWTGDQRRCSVREEVKKSLCLMEEWANTDFGFRAGTLRRKIVSGAFQITHLDSSFMQGFSCLFP